MRVDSQPKTSVLVVEDESLIRMDAVYALEDDGFDVFEAGDGDEALALIDEGRRCDVLFTDVNMPGSMNGLVLADEICVRLPAVRVVVASGRPFPGGTLPCAGRFLAKPYRLSEVSDIIRQLTAGQHPSS